MESIVLWIKHITEWLYVPLYQNQLFFIDYWSLVHIWTGFTVMISMQALKFNRTWAWLVFFLFTYELIEVLMVYTALNVFYPETIKDQITDVVVGMAGGFWAYRFLQYRSRRIKPVPVFFSLELILTSLSCAFVWTGNFTFFSSSEGMSKPFDWAGFAFTTFGCALMLYSYSVFLEKQTEKKQSNLTYFLSFLAVVMMTVLLWRGGMPNLPDLRLYLASVLIGLMFFVTGTVAMYRFFIHIVQKGQFQFQ